MAQDILLLPRIACCMCLGTHPRSAAMGRGGVGGGPIFAFLFVMSAPDRKELRQMSDEDCSRATGSPFAFHTANAHTARGDRSRQTADPGPPWSAADRAASDRRGWHAGSVNPIAVPGRHYRNAHPPASSRTRTGSRLLLPYRFTTIQISRRRDAPQPQKCPASAVGSRPPMPCGTATPWAGGSRTRVRSSGRWCRRGEGKGTV